MTLLVLLLASGSRPATEWETPVVIALKLFTILFLVLLNGFFVASEFAIVKVRGSQLNALGEDAKFARDLRGAKSGGSGLIFRRRRAARKPGSKTTPRG